MIGVDKPRGSVLDCASPLALFSRMAWRRQSGRRLPHSKTSRKFLDGPQNPAMFFNPLYRRKKFSSPFSGTGRRIARRKDAVENHDLQPGRRNDDDFEIHLRLKSSFSNSSIVPPDFGLAS